MEARMFVRNVGVVSVTIYGTVFPKGIIFVREMYPLTQFVNRIVDGVALHTAVDVRWYTCRLYSVLPASYRTMITDVWHARIKTSDVCACQHSIVCRSQCNLKCNLSYISHRKYVLKAIIICITEEEFGPTRNQETGHWKRLHGEEFCDLYYSGYQERVCIQGFGGKTWRKETTSKTYS